MWRQWAQARPALPYRRQRLEDGMRAVGIGLVAHVPVQDGVVLATDNQPEVAVQHAGGAALELVV